MMGLRELIPLVEGLWKNRRSELTALGSRVLNAMMESHVQSHVQNADESTLSRAYLELSGIFDWTSGGFGSAPKFPLAQNLLFLLRYWHRTGEMKAQRSCIQKFSSYGLAGVLELAQFAFQRDPEDVLSIAPADWLEKARMAGIPVCEWVVSYAYITLPAIVYGLNYFSTPSEHFVVKDFTSAKKAIST